MKSRAKIAVSIPLATLKSVERARRRLRTSRSAVVTTALDEWLRGQDLGAADARYVEGYLRVPERMDEIEAVAAQATASWGSWK